MNEWKGVGRSFIHLYPEDLYIFMFTEDVQSICIFIISIYLICCETFWSFVYYLRLIFVCNKPSSHISWKSNIEQEFWKSNRNRNLNILCTFIQFEYKKIFTHRSRISEVLQGWIHPRPVHPEVYIYIYTVQYTRYLLFTIQLHRIISHLNGNCIQNKDIENEISQILETNETYSRELGCCQYHSGTPADFFSRWLSIYLPVTRLKISVSEHKKKS